MKFRPTKTFKKNHNANIVYFEDDLIKCLIFKFLRMYYPIDRVKINGKFKRAIIVGDKVYSISNEKNSFLTEIILKISNSFNISENDSKYIIFDYFKLK
jgi:hypothetical protein